MEGIGRHGLGLRALRSAGGEPLRPADSVRLFMHAVHLPVRPWSPRSQGFPGEADKTPLHRIVSENLESWVPVRQWVISVPKRLRGVLADRPPAMTSLSRIFPDEIEQLLCDAADVPVGSGVAGQARPRLGAVSFQHRFGSALNRHVHLHACVTDGVFEWVAAAGDVRFHAARPLSPTDLATVTQRVRRRFVRWLRRKGFLSREAATDMLAWQHSGFAVDASVRISPSDCDIPAFFRRLEHLLRYCARPAFALE